MANEYASSSVAQPETHTRYGAEWFPTPHRLNAEAMFELARGLNPVTGAASFYGLGWNVEYGRHGLQWGHAGAFSTGAHCSSPSGPTAYPYRTASRRASGHAARWRQRWCST